MSFKEYIFPGLISIPTARIGFVTIYLVFGEMGLWGQSFTEISQILGISQVCQDFNRMSGGVLFFDYNGDNYPDIYVIGGESANVLYRNNWDGTFTNVTQHAGVALHGTNTVGASAGDIDNDGDDDLFVTTNTEVPNVLYRNNGDGTFTDISQAAGITHQSWSTSVSFGDYNLDGLVDIYVNNYADFSALPFEQNLNGGRPNFLYQNVGNNMFVEVATSLGVDDIGCGLAVAFTDVDNDGDSDLYVANDFGLQFDRNELYVNNYPQIDFTKTAAAAGIDAGINAMGIAIGDYDEDGDFDYYVTNIGDNPFFENLEQGSLFTEVGLAKQLNNPDGTSWGTAFLDYDNDTYLDLVVANGEVIDVSHQNNENRLFRGKADGSFEDVSVSAGIASTKNCRGFSSADMDNDGDLDLMFGVVTKDLQSEDHVLIYENKAQNDQHWLKLNLVGATSHRDGFGSLIRVVIGSRSLIREADGGSSYLSQHSKAIHFGLGNFDQIDSMIVTWPGGHRDVLTDIPANTHLSVLEGGHWYRNQNQETFINAGDSILLGGAYQSEDGTFFDFIKDSQGLDSIRLVTKLTVRESVVVGIQEPEERSAVNFILFPNPVNSDFQLEYTLSRTSNVLLSVSDVLGRTEILLDKRQDPGRHALHFPKLPNPSHETWHGLYLFRLVIDDQVYVLKALHLAD